MPAIDEQAAEPIREAFRNVMMGMSITRAWRRYREVGGRTDPRAKPGPISYSAFRRLLSNPRLRGVWAYGRRRNVWSHKRDGMRQIEQPETEVIIAYVAELQIIDDETFDAVQAVLEHNKLGPRGPKKAKQLTLADLITELFVCAGCTEAAAEAGESRGSVRFYQSGANGDSMRCRHGSLCPHKAMVKRRDAAKILCKEVAQLIRQDQSLVLDVVRRSLEYGAAGAKETQERLALVQRTIAKNARRMVDLTEFLADACDEERAVISAKIEALKLDNADLKAEASRLTRLLQSQRVLEPAEAEQLFEDCLQLLTNAADGQLGEEAVYRAFSIIKAITQGRIDVEVVKRPKRSRGYVRGKFTYDSSLISEMILGTVVATPSASPPSLVSFWLRSPCRMDLIAERVHQLVDIEGYSFHEAAELLTAQGEIVSHSYAWQCHRRYWQMMGEPPPDIPYNNRRPRRSA